MNTGFNLLFSWKFTEHSDADTGVSKKVQLRLKRSDPSTHETNNNNNKKGTSRTRLDNKLIFFILPPNAVTIFPPAILI